MRTNTSRELLYMIDKKFGPIYTNKGNGRVQYGGQSVSKFVNKIVDNRVLDLYLKYRGLKLLNTATLVPISLLLGSDYLHKLLKGQSGGGEELIPRKIPIFDHPIVGQYLKLIGLPVAGLKTGTLVPLGVLMIIYSLYSESKQSGGYRTIFGETSVPPSITDNIGQLSKGLPAHNNLFHIPRRLPEVNNDMQLSCSTNNCNPNVYSSHYKVEPATIEMPGFSNLPNPADNISPSKASIIWEGNLGVNNNTAINPSMAGGGKKYNYFDYIKDPISNKYINLHTNKGSKILENYIKSM